MLWSEVGDEFSLALSHRTIENTHEHNKTNYIVGPLVTSHNKVL